MSLKEFANRVVPCDVLTEKQSIMLFRYFHCDDKPPNLPFTSTQQKNPTQKLSTVTVVKATGKFIASPMADVCRDCGRSTPRELRHLCIGHCSQCKKYFRSGINYVLHECM